MQRTVFLIPKMDCASDERLVRMALEGARVQRLDFDLGQRQLTAFHDATPQDLLERLAPLNFNARVSETRAASPDEGLAIAPAGSGQSVLRILFAINATMFIVELVGGWLAHSTGLLADSLDMFADAAVYAVSLYAVGKAASTQFAAARFSGYVQLLLALVVLGEVARRLVGGSAPEAGVMVGIAFLALVANAAGVALLARHRHRGVHMRASWIFTSTDVIANAGVIIAAVLVAWTGSRLPDLVVGFAISVVVLVGSIKILRLSRRPEAPGASRAA